MLQLINQLLGSLLLVCLNISVLAQDGTVFKGKVVDIETLMPLQYATVVIEGSSIGVATNSEGDFMLNIPETYSSTLIKVSYVGYKPVYIEANGVENTSQSIYLEALNIVLGDVIVKAKKSTAEKIISKAIWSIPDNYETNPNVLKCFYREITFINNEEKFATEALLDVYKTAYQDAREDKVKVNKVRQVGASPESGFDFEGGAYYRVSDDVIANRPGFLLRENLKYFDFSTSRVLGSGDESVVVISFEPDRGAINNAHSYNLGNYWDAYIRTQLSYSGEIYIREADYAIIKVEYWLERDNLRYAEKQYLTRIPDESIISLTGVLFSAEYRKQDEKYFLSSTNGEVQFRISNSDLGVSQDYRVHNELLTVDRSDFRGEHFEYDEISDAGDLVTNYQDSYEEDFWKDENIVQAYSRLKRLGKSDIGEALFEDRLTTALNIQRAKKPLETLFLHTDRNKYIAGDEIFFKAYVIEDATGFPSFLSKTFYTLLSDSAGNIISKSRFILKSGRGYGNMRIPVHLKTGVYKIISYPSNMQNFNIENCFAQSIQIEDEISFVEGRNEVRSKESKLLEKEDIDIQFLPEGGSLVPGHRNNIAFCAVDCRGIPAKLTLLVRDNNNRIIDTIQTNSAGLGQFKLQIQNNKTYYARVLDSSGLGNKRYSLPGIKKGGAGMELVAQTKNTIQIKLLSGSDTKEIYRLVLVKGNKVLCSEEREISGSKLIKLKYKNTGTGVATLTVFRRDTPVAERLVFLDTEQRLKISSNLEYGAYPVRGRMKIDIQVTDSQDRPVQTFLSTSVIDSINCLSENLSTPDIRHLFWLRSSLKMNTPVHIPNMVLRRIGMDANNLVEDINLLLLTYGWRKYSVDYILEKQQYNKSEDLLNYDLISGKVVASKKRKSGSSIRELQVFEPGILYNYSLYSDKDGRFTYQPESFLFDRQLLWNFGNNKLGKKWRITFDSIFNNDYAIGAASVNPLDYYWNSKTESVKTDESFDPAVFMRYIKIPEVNITAQRFDKSEERKRLVNTLSNSGNVTSGSYKDFKNLPDLEAIINSIKPPSKIVRYDFRTGELVLWYYYRSPMKGLSGVEHKAIFVVNDSPVSYDMYDLLYITPEIIDRVSIITGPQAFTYFGAKALGGAIMVYTKDPGDVDTRMLESDPGIVISQALCDTGKEFYTPNYYDETLDIDRADYRLTAHWDPDIVTDSNGKATIEYFNIGYNSYAVIIIQGMSSSGEPVYKRLRYQVVRDE